MLEKTKHGNGKRNGAGANCSDVIASGQDFRTARVAIAAQKIRHRDIVNLKQSVLRTPPFKERQAAPLSRLRSEPGRRPQSSRLCPPFACDLRAYASPRVESGKPPDGSITRPACLCNPQAIV
jgi:hypothetical protein